MIPPIYRGRLAFLILTLALTACATAPPVAKRSETSGRHDSSETTTREDGNTDALPDAAASEPDTLEPDTPEPEAPEVSVPSLSEAEADASEPAGGFTRETLYRLLVADLAGRQGNVDTALEGYLATIEETRDPRVAERATRLALYADRSDAALEAARRWIALAPENQEAHSILARLYLDSGSAGSALEHLRAVITRTDDGADTGLREAVKLLGKSQSPEYALQAADSLAGDYPEAAVAHFAVARFASRVGATDRALSAVDRALSIESDYTQALVLRSRILIDSGRADEAFEQLRAGIAQRPNDRSLVLGYIRLLDEAGRSDAAVPVMQQAFERFGDDPVAVYMLSLLAIQTETWDDARIYLERMLAMDTRTSVAHYYLGRIAEMNDDCTEALRRYIKVGRGDFRLDAGRRAAVCMARLDRVAEARLHIERLRSRYRNPGPRVKIALTHAQVEQLTGHPEQALQVLSDAVESYPDDLELRYNRALAAAGDHFDLARADLELIVEREPEDARALNALGYMLANRNIDLQRAHDLIGRALELNPDDPATLDSMGWVLYRLGRNEQALEYLRQSWSTGADAEVGAHLGEVLWVSGQREEARRIWDQAADLEAGDATALQETRERLDP